MIETAYRGVLVERDLSGYAALNAESEAVRKFSMSMQPSSLTDSKDAVALEKTIYLASHVVNNVQLREAEGNRGVQPSGRGGRLGRKQLSASGNPDPVNRPARSA